MKRLKATQLSSRLKTTYIDEAVAHAVLALGYPNLKDKQV